VGCLFEGLAPLSAIFWTPALILEPIICILVLKKVFLDRQQRTELATFLARDRLVVVIFAVTKNADDHTSLLYFLVYVRQLLDSCYGVCLTIHHLQNIHATHCVNYCLGSVSFLYRPLHAVGLCLSYVTFLTQIDSWSVALPSLLCNRLLLNMRGRFARGSEPVRSSLLIELATLRTSADSLGVPDEE
jgi:hypothetical protein